MLKGMKIIICGYCGKMGQAVKKAAKNDPECEVVAGVDINFFESDIYSNVDKKYDFIITNPPIRVGKEILYRILLEAKDHLKLNGEVYFVIKFKAYFCRINDSG